MDSLKRPLQYVPLYAEKAYSILSDARCGGWSSGQKECIIRDVCKWDLGAESRPNDSRQYLAGCGWAHESGDCGYWGGADTLGQQRLPGVQSTPRSNGRPCARMRRDAPGGAFTSFAHVCLQMTISERLSDCAEDSGAANHCPFPRFLCLEVIFWRALLYIYIYYIKFIYYIAPDKTIACVAFRRFDAEGVSCLTPWGSNHFYRMKLARTQNRVAPARKAADTYNCRALVRLNRYSRAQSFSPVPHLLSLC